LRIASNHRRHAVASPTRKNAATPRDAVDFAAGSLESKLAAIGKAVPAREWERIPIDYFANLDHYLHHSPKRK